MFPPAARTACQNKAMPAVISLRVEDGHFADVRADGLVAHPEAATPAVRAAVAVGLTGAPADLPTGAIAARVRAAVPFGVELAGATPRTVAEAVRQIAGGEPNPTRVGAFTAADIDRLTAGWRECRWKLIPERPLSAAMNLALDEALHDRVAAGDRPPTLRFWGWTEPAVIVGRSQAVANEVDPAAGLTVTRRMSGGGAMFVRPGEVITYSLILPEKAVAGLSIRRSYEVCDAWVVSALRSVGVEAYYVPVNDIGWAEGKIAGAAQARRNGVVLHHTTMAYTTDPDEVGRVLRIGLDKPTERAVSSAAKMVSPLVRQTSLSRDAIVERMADEFRQRFGGESGEPNADEWDAAERLASEKYTSEAWTRRFG